MKTVLVIFAVLLVVAVPSSIAAVDDSNSSSSILSSLSTPALPPNISTSSAEGLNNDTSSSTALPPSGGDVLTAWQIIFKVLIVVAIAGCSGLAASLVTITLFYFLLTCCGCTSNGIRGGSYAANYQSVYHDGSDNDGVESGSCFSCCQSTGARGCCAIYTLCRVVFFSLIYGPLIGWLIWPHFL